MSQRLCVSEALRGCHAVGLGLMEAISDSTHCFDPPGAGALVAELAAQVHHVHVEASAFRCGD